MATVIKPGDMLRVTKRVELWKQIRTNALSEFSTLDRGETLVLLARNPSSEDWWAKLVEERPRNWRDEILFVMSASGRCGFVIREYVALVR